MAPRDPCLAWLNRGLRDLGYAISLEVRPSGRRVRLRATLPVVDGGWKQQPITTSLEFPGDLELHRRALEPFPEHPWFGVASGQASETAETISGIEALRRTELW